MLARNILRVFGAIIAAVLPFGAVGLPKDSGILSPQEVRGRTIYRTGKLASGKDIIATLGGGENQVPASIVPCVTCHGADGRGRQEAGVVPSSIRWEELSRPYEVSSADGRRHSAYTVQLLIRAITQGLDPAGNRLDTAMPRFALSQSDAEDLVTYLKKLGAESDPGLTSDSIRIGTLLPAGGKPGDLDSAVRAALKAYFDQLNRSGGVYGRRIELVFGELPRNPAEIPQALARFLKSQSVFALVSSSVAGAEEASGAVLREEKVPLVGAWSLLPVNISASNPYLFYLDSGLLGQSRSLADFALKKFAPNLRAVIFSSQERFSISAAEAARSELAQSGWAHAPEISIGSDANEATLIERLKKSNPQIAFAFLPETGLFRMLALSKTAGIRPIFLVPGSLATSNVLRELQSLSSLTFLAVSFLPSDVSPDAGSEYRVLAANYGLSSDHAAAQFTALAEAKILTEALKRAGRDLSRENLIQALETLTEYISGYSPPVTFGPAKHAGIDHFHIVELNAATGELTEADSAP